MSLPPATLDAPSAPRLAPFARFGTVFAWGVRRTLSGKRPYVAGGLALLAGVGLGLLTRGTADRIARDVWEALDNALLGVAIPLVALALVGGGYGEEIQDQTLLFHLVRPVSRRTVYVARYASGLVPAAVAGAAMLVALPVTAGVALPAAAIASIAALGAIGVAVTGALYYALAALFRRGLIAGLVYTFVVEGLFQFLPGSIQKLSLMHHVRSLYHRWTDSSFAAISERVRTALTPRPEGMPFDPRRPPRDATEMVFQEGAREAWTSVESALLICAAVILVALFFGGRAVARKDFPLKD